MTYSAEKRTGPAPTKRGGVYIETYGCQMNRADSEVVMSLLEERGHHRAAAPEDAEVILVNTCIVREHAQEKALTNISRFRRYKDMNPGVRIGVLGCMASRTGKIVAERLPFLDWVLGPDAYRHLPRLLAEPARNGPVLIADGFSDELYDDLAPSRREGVNAWVVITRGCNNFCTYCVVPYARGPERYRSSRTILEEVRAAVADGFPQVTLLGQNVNSWHDDGKDFSVLLAEVASVPGLARVRFITSHPKDCPPRLLEVMGDGGVVCPELHLPVQSGSNNVLRRMGRGYTREHYLRLVEAARRHIPNLLLSTDLILGFPGETEDDFRDTEALVSEVEFDDAFVYRYSERPGTAAAKFEDDIPEQVKVERLMRIGEIVRATGEKHRRALIGSGLEVLVEGPSAKSSAERMGRTAAGHVVVFPGHDPAGSLVRVKLESLSGFTFRGKKV